MKSLMTTPVSLMLLLGLSAPVVALDDEVPMQPPVRASEYRPLADEPQIVIRAGEDATYYEYRVGGQITEIKVVPNRGPAYYLVPADGGGWLRHDEPRMVVPSWVLFRW